MTTQSSQTGIAALFATATLGELLRLFMLEPEREFYQRELQRLTGAHLRQLQRDLARLGQSGLVAKQVRGNRAYYSAVVAHPAFADMRAAMIKTVGLGDQLRHALARLEDKVTLAFIYGSLASGDDVAQSDVDLLLVGSVSRRESAAALAEPARLIGRELNPMILPVEDFIERRRSGDHFVSSVLSGPRIWLVGDEAALAALA